MKPFSWSFSRLKNFETCPKKYYEVDVAKHHKESTEALDYGNAVHDALRAAVMFGRPLPPTMADYQKWVNSAKKMQKAGFEVRCEQNYALTKEFQPCEWFGPNAWLRMKGDLVAIMPPYAVILDYKTGKPMVDSKQLMLMSQCVFVHHPDVNECESRFVWLKTGDSSKETYTRDQMANEWLGLLPRVERMKIAQEKLDYPPTPNKLCFRYCPVTSCPFHGKRT